ncbi:MAG: hypothetical protein A3G33_11450 [Omnitrophica bacterium RIFCSPLOWO2_12_FULL_44_17]|uniref:Uncharacterized protein n=1 Tax=Candidatus Danuiimicrobium aquiferis TaxID=1801832 RepID=A0A1G1KS10_9BACT|nr:MAG: hypothetical protein A3B72_09290 [Omnitrophica bacterium RIFCSPHIGHO2_02_FULL_45_28]OGW91204.1 MAG: hypothetical protein A3E74_02820 [Omnitrophica bacterium RIFCSPHIGHO2_12_FULL_44_12]OGW95605.1 MAG: hypothetical protein A3G33_11450 [Omnitrophica bacterium RIFCSPLOWO2_12_FULL_44_17]OGX03681.1 MAG: hypothetical protein A3J12_01045 [Omnitrophica bacterium RIFCSPLOWO2_02_FULL_44_11]
MLIIRESLTLTELKHIAASLFGDMVKAVADVERELIAVDAELHADLEALLLEDGSKQKNLWGLNLYPEAQEDEFVEFDSMINMRPSQGNKSRGVENQALREKILAMVAKRITG